MSQIPVYNFSLSDLTGASGQQNDGWSMSAQTIDLQQQQPPAAQPTQPAQSQWQQQQPPAAQPPQNNWQQQQPPAAQPPQNNWQQQQPPAAQPPQNNWQQQQPPAAQPPQNNWQQQQPPAAQPAQNQWQQQQPPAVQSPQNNWQQQQPPAAQPAQNQWQQQQPPAAQPTGPAQNQWQQQQPPVQHVQPAQSQWQQQPQAPPTQWQQQPEAQTAQSQWQQQQPQDPPAQPAQNQWQQQSGQQDQTSQYDLVHNPQGSNVSKYAQSSALVSVPSASHMVDLSLTQITGSLASEQPQQEQHQVIGLFDHPHDVQVNLMDSSIDPSSPLYSAKSFEQLGLREDLLKGLYAMGFSKPSKVQERALPLMIANPPVNMIAQSQSGTGKTAAFALAMLSRVDVNVNKPQAICLVPSRELARQIRDVTLKMAQFTKVTAASLVKETKRRVFNEHIIVGTPGTVHDCIRRRYIDVTGIKSFVLDEADNMLDQDGLGDQSIRIKSMIKTKHQVLLFSATFPEYVRKFASKFAPGANEMTLANHELSVDVIRQFYMDCQDEEQKYDVLCNLYELLTVSQSIIFCRRRDTAFKIGEKMRNQGHAIGCLHGLLAPDERDRIMDDFRRGEFKVLITTNVISRGIDVLQVSLVVNYDMPLDVRNDADPEAYLHRIGRTGRFGRKGVSIIFVHDNPTWKQMKFLEEHFQRSIERVPTEDWEEVERILKPVL